ncbi:MULTISPECIES: hypothetical protein [unclassified Undibacterium]|uniref:hypothetical protein n=1 Tax=unclassified Undibacterium TaxID=2630295 RepID=UPI002AC94178|nr:MULTISPECIES: hypothetical protein [unclassified Undibacterium]MEB0139485.1 hypothetical protein [Undibacterium sp. CCC2.1]MEB0172406.1 hypothetical protein [Undibacterium sp. CCC1.1]MEB0175733.1 hypothetical protein [Undibacterium sp. CCC3.4]MEB0214521.1 hypothetical protein [Undibacterium sp. 5I2]WPX42916.1 hypothetical protein RHM61_16245 [Undibacterium sp. CCC3.4]
MCLTKLPRLNSRLLACVLTLAVHAGVIICALDAKLTDQPTRENLSARPMTVYVGFGNARPAKLSTLNNAPTALPQPPQPGLSHRGAGELGAAVPMFLTKPRAVGGNEQALASFLPSNQMDWSAMPVSEPDFAALTDLVDSPSPLKARIYVDQNGQVIRVLFLRTNGLRPGSLDQIEGILKATRFIPARLNGKDSASYLDLELHVAEVEGSGLP